MKVSGGGKRGWLGRGLLGTLFILVVALWPAPSAFAQPPTVVFTEDFEQGVGPTQTLALGAYVGKPPATPRYTAAPYWLDGTNCNGYIVPSDAPAAISGCSKGTQLQAMAAALGNVGKTPHNHAVAAHTDNSSVHPGADKVEFQTTNPGDPVIMGAVNRFIVFSVDVAVSNCQSNHPALKFALLDGGTEVPAFTKPVDPCVANTAPVQSGRFFSDLGILNSSPTIGLVMRNGQGNANGNDHAFDNITVLDATPDLAKAFAPTQRAAGNTSRLTFTITNTSELAAKPGWSFTDALPRGLTLADQVGAATTCTKGAVTASPGATSFSVTGDLNAGQASCTVTVSVTSPTAGKYTNGPGGVTTRGLEKPDASSVTFVAPSQPGPTTSTTVATKLPRSGTPTAAMTATGMLVVDLGALLLALSVLVARRDDSSSSTNPTGGRRPATRTPPARWLVSVLDRLRF